MTTNTLLSTIAILTLSGLTCACGNSNPKQLITEKSWDLVGWSDPGEITKNMDYLPTIRFEDGGFNGNGGTNGFRGNYRATDGGRIKLNKLRITEMGGPREIMIMESTYINILSKVTQWSVEGGTLTLSDGTEKNQLRYKTDIRKIDRPLKHHKWTLVGVQRSDQAGANLTQWGKGKITFSIGDGGAISGWAGVNQYSGQIKLDEGNKIGFGKLITTKMAGPAEAMAEEAKYLTLLPAMTRWEITGQQLLLSNDDQSHGLVFKAE